MIQQTTSDIIFIFMQLRIINSLLHVINLIVDKTITYERDAQLMITRIICMPLSISLFSVAKKKK